MSAQQIVEPLHELRKSIQSIYRVSGKINKNNYDKFMDLINTSQENIIKHLLQTPTQVISPQPVTFAQAAKRQKETTERGINKAPIENKIIVPYNEISGSNGKPTETAVKEITSKVCKVLRDNNSNSAIVNSVATNAGKIIVNLHGEINDSLKSVTKNVIGDKVKFSKLMYPRLSINNIPDHFSISDKTKAIQTIIKDNAFIEGFIKTPEDLEILFSYKGRYGNNLVMRVNPEIRKQFLEKKYIILGKCMCKIFDRIDVSHCQKCCKFGHKTNQCKSTQLICSLCSENHLHSNCPLKDDISKHKCYNCFNNNNQEIKANSHTHNAFSYNCPEYFRQKQILAAKINWGNCPPLITDSQA